MPVQGLNNQKRPSDPHIFIQAFYDEGRNEALVLGPVAQYFNLRIIIIP